MTPASDALWAHYHQTGDPLAREQILTQHLGLVHHVARGIAERVGDAVTFDDLLSAGSLGLVKALDSYDPDRGASFSTFATPRIRGAVLDELRAADPRPRRVRQRLRAITKARAEIEEREHRPAEPREIAAALDIPLATYWEWLEGADRGTAVSIEWSRAVEPGSGSLLDVVPDANQPALDASMLAESDREVLREGIAALPEQQRVVLALYYYKSLTLRQIAEVLHVTESRVSQIRSAAIRTLRESIREELVP